MPFSAARIHAGVAVVGFVGIGVAAGAAGAGSADMDPGLGSEIAYSDVADGADVETGKDLAG